MVGVVASLCGCSAMYEGFRAVGREYCYKLPYADQQSCLKEVEYSYEQYHETRRDVITAESKM